MKRWVIYRWQDRCISGWIGGRKDEWSYGWKDGWVKGRIGGWKARCIYGWKDDGRIGERKGQMDL